MSSVPQGSFKTQGQQPIISVNKRINYLQIMLYYKKPQINLFKDEQTNWKCKNNKTTGTQCYWTQKKIEIYR